MDVISPHERSRIMSLVRSKDTEPEQIVRRLAHRSGYRFGLHHRDLPGCPDLVFRACRAVVFVNGCFWHRHDCPNGCRLPKTRRKWWCDKLEKNRKRDQATRRRLYRIGWRVMVIWECQLKDIDRVRRRLERFLGN
ncbi:MAG: DNA mismatch endonuclease Vsr [Planctomycetes bacterium]|nr:DNA mismatch endonuclease Vsr [Planctomycetota bacterium]